MLKSWYCMSLFLLLYERTRYFTSKMLHQLQISLLCPLQHKGLPQKNTHPYWCHGKQVQDCKFSRCLLVNLLVSKADMKLKLATWDKCMPLWRMDMQYLKTFLCYYAVAKSPTLKCGQLMFGVLWPFCFSPPLLARPANFQMGLQREELSA